MNKKRNFFRMLVTVALMLASAIGIQAQTWTASAVGEGTFYLYSVSEGKFLTAGTTKGVRASLTTQGGIPLILSAIDATNGIYSVSSEPTFTGRYMGIGTDGNEAYFDVSSSSTTQYSDWKFIAVEGQTNTS